MFLSAFGDSDIVDEAMKMGALGYLVKPWTCGKSARRARGADPHREMKSAAKQAGN
jgi:response regulator of citrate/malate metabolism